MNYKIKISAIIVILIAFVFLILSLFIKIDDYKAGINGNSSVHGTYQFSSDSPHENMYMTIDEDSETYFHFESNNQLIQSGTLERGAFYVLYKDDATNIYGKIIKSYKKIYFVDENLNITAYDKMLNELLLPHQDET